MSKATSSVNAKDALGRLKVPVGLYPNVARIETCIVLALSAAEFGAFNWRNNPVLLTIYLDSIDRHTIALRAGQDCDPKTGRPHAAHISACSAIVMEARALGILIDDRFEKDVAADLLSAYTPAAYAAARAKVKAAPARTLSQVRAEVTRVKAAVARRRKASSAATPHRRRPQATILARSRRPRLRPA